MQCNYFCEIIYIFQGTVCSQFTHSLVMEITKNAKMKVNVWCSKTLLMVVQVSYLLVKSIGDPAIKIP